MDKLSIRLGYRNLIHNENYNGTKYRITMFLSLSFYRFAFHQLIANLLYRDFFEAIFISL